MRRELSGLKDNFETPLRTTMMTRKADDLTVNVTLSIARVAATADVLVRTERRRREQNLTGTRIPSPLQLFALRAHCGRGRRSQHSVFSTFFRQSTRDALSESELFAYGASLQGR